MKTPAAGGGVGQGGRPSNNRLPEAYRDLALSLVRERYADFGPTLAATTESAGDDNDHRPYLPLARSEVEITRVLEFEAALFEPAVIHPEASPDIIERHRSWLTPRLMDPVSGLMIFAFHSTVIKTPRATSLVDTCSGNDKERPHKLRYHRKNWPYIANLAAAGFAPEDIDYVLCTHLHADHVGWNTRLLDGRWVPTFPNARYLFARAEWEHWRVAEWRAAYTTDPYYEDSLLPIMESGQAELVATDYAFDDSVWIEPWPGHTPGHVCVVVGSSQPSVVLSGDIMHTPLQCAEPQLNSCFCVDAEMARATRRRLIETFADRPVMIIPAHFPTPTAGWIRAQDGSFASVSTTSAEAASGLLQRCWMRRYSKLGFGPWFR